MASKGKVALFSYDLKTSGSFLIWLVDRGLSPKLLSFVAYCLALLPPVCKNVPPVTVSEGVERLKTFLNSLGRYGPGKLQVLFISWQMAYVSCVGGRFFPLPSIRV